MLKYGLLLLALISTQVYSDIIKKSETDTWQVDGLHHYVKSKEDQRFIAMLVSSSNNDSVVAFSPPNEFCSYQPQYMKVKVLYQWVNYVSMCIDGSNVWIPKSQRGINFVKQKFTSYADVKIVFDDQAYSFSTKRFTSVRQRWENTVRTLGDAI